MESVRVEVNRLQLRRRVALVSQHVKEAEVALEKETNTIVTEKAVAIKHD